MLLAIWSSLLDLFGSLGQSPDSGHEMDPDG